MSKKGKFSGASAFISGRVDANIAICCCLLGAGRTNDIVLQVIDIAKACNLSSKTTVIREINNFVKRNLVNRKANIKSKRSIHTYNLYDVMGSEEDIIAYNHEVIDKFNNSKQVREGKAPSIEYPDFTWGYCQHAKLLLRKNAVRTRESANAKYCEEIVKSKACSEALEFVKEYSEQHPNLGCNGWIAEGKYRFSNNACNTSSDATLRQKELRILNGGTKKLYSYDTNASIIRVAYALTNDEPESFHKDIYKVLGGKVARKYNCDDETTDALLSNHRFRKKFKKTVLPVFMRDYGTTFKVKVYKYIITYLNSEELRNQYSTMSDYFDSLGMVWYNGYYDSYEVISEIITSLTGDLEPKYEDFEMFYELYKEVLIGYCHSDRFRKKIFIWESLLHIYIMKELTELGYTVFNIYDEEYIDEKIGEQRYQEIWLKCMAKTKRDYLNFISYYENKHYSPEKVQKRCEAFLERHEKIKQKIQSFATEKNIPFKEAEKLYLKKHYMYKDGFIYRNRRH